MPNITPPMLDALLAVVSQGGFQKATAELKITQSAVTQRILQLEDQIGSMVVTRTTPPQLTPKGEVIMRYALHNRALQQQMLREFEETPSKKITFRVSLNHDSLNAWFHRVVTSFGGQHSVWFDCALAHEEKTLKPFREGQVDIAISTIEAAVTGAESQSIGELEYLLVGNNEIARKYQKSLKKDNFYRTTPTVLFSKDDYVCREFYQRFTDVAIQEIPSHIMPSNAYFYEFLLGGAGYALVPRPEVETFLRAKKLFQLDAKKLVSVQYYLHHWRVGSAIYRQLVDAVFLEARESLSRSSKRPRSGGAR